MKDDDNIPKTNPDEIEALIKRVEGYQLPNDDKDLITRLLRMWLVILRLMDKPKTTLDKVKQMLFGKRGGKQSKNESDKASTADTPSTTTASDTSADSSQAKQSAPTGSEAESEVKQKRRGHGRIPTSAYTGARIVHCVAPAMKEGSACLRQGCLGRLYDPDEVHKFIRFLRHEAVYRFVMRRNNHNMVFYHHILTRQAERAIFRFEALVTM